MKNIKSTVKSFIKDEQGATAIEYGLLVSLIALAIVVGAALVGSNLNQLFNNIAGCIAAPTTTNCKFTAATTAG